MTLDPSLILTGESRQEETMPKVQEIDGREYLTAYEIHLVAKVDALRQSLAQLTEERNTLHTALKELAERWSRKGETEMDQAMFAKRPAAAAAAAIRVHCASELSATLATGEDQ
jgi:uncharacterized protein YlxW (UPF0749 family)